MWLPYHVNLVYDIAYRPGLFSDIEPNPFVDQNKEEEINLQNFDCKYETTKLMAEQTGYLSFRMFCCFDAYKLFSTESTISNCHTRFPF